MMLAPHSGDIPGRNVWGRRKLVRRYLPIDAKRRAAISLTRAETLGEEPPTLAHAWPGDLRLAADHTVTTVRGPSRKASKRVVFQDRRGRYSSCTAGVGHNVRPTEA